MVVVPRRRVDEKKELAGLQRVEEEEEDEDDELNIPVL